MESGNEKANPEAEEGQHSISTAAAGTASSAVIERQVQKRIFKIIVIGDSNVGKTCLTFRFCGGRFPEKTEATIGVDFREKTVEINGELVKVIIAGDPRTAQEQCISLAVHSISCSRRMWVSDPISPFEAFHAPPPTPTL